MTRVIGLVRACHPVPTLAVTAFGGALGVSAGLPAGTLLMLVAAILTGQLFIGWNNDALDAERDRRAGRTDKPLAGGEIARPVVIGAATVALAATVVLSVGLGGPTGVAALMIVVCGWGYNLGLRSTVVSFLPYLVAFGALPATVTLALPGHPLPAAWAIATGALLGVAAHFANVLPDLDADATSGIRGLPHRLGATGTAIGTLLLLLGATVALLLGPIGGIWRWIVLVAAVIGAVAGGIVLVRNRDHRWLFRVLIGLAGVDVLAFVLSGAGLLGGG